MRFIQEPGSSFCFPNWVCSLLPGPALHLASPQGAARKDLRKRISTKDEKEKWTESVR